MNFFKKTKTCLIFNQVSVSLKIKKIDLPKIHKQQHITKYKEFEYESYVLDKKDRIRLKNKEMGEKKKNEKKKQKQK